MSVNCALCGLFVVFLYRAQVGEDPKMIFVVKMVIVSEA